MQLLCKMLEHPQTTELEFNLLSRNFNFLYCLLIEGNKILVNFQNLIPDLPTLHGTVLPVTENKLVQYTYYI